MENPQKKARKTLRKNYGRLQENAWKNLRKKHGKS
jgi:hypothetical protein